MEQDPKATTTVIVFSIATESFTFMTQEDWEYEKDFEKVIFIKGVKRSIDKHVREVVDTMNRQLKMVD